MASPSPSHTFTESTLFDEVALETADLLIDDAGFIPPHGNYRELLSYRKAEVIYDLTYWFCHRFLAKTHRTIDQMIQAPDLGNRTLWRAAKRPGTSKETEIKLIGVAQASLEELLADYNDLLHETLLSGKKTPRKYSFLPDSPDERRSLEIGHICLMGPTLRETRQKRLQIVY